MAPIHLLEPITVRISNFLFRYMLNARNLLLLGAQMIAMATLPLSAIRGSRRQPRITFATITSQGQYIS